MPASLEGLHLISNGSRLKANVLTPNAPGPRPTAILLHGIPGNERNFDLAYALRDAGWNTLIFHYRGCWGSEGVYALPNILEDVHAAVDYAMTRPDVDPRYIVGIGMSLGGWGVVAAAAQDERLRAVVCLCPLVDPRTFPLPPHIAENFAAQLVGITGTELMAQWAALTPLPDVAGCLAGRPTLLLTADADELFDVAHIRPLAEAMPFATWQRLSQANHTFDAHRPQLVRVVRDWLTLNVWPAPPFPSAYTVRSPLETDHGRVLAVLSAWWGGRDLRHLLPRLFFQHFNDTSLIVEQQGELVGFLIGFVSQSEPGVAYIHFVGVHPDHRKNGLARALYMRFFALAQARGAREVHAITSPVNSGSIAFHQRMGFTVSAPMVNYDGADGERVTLVKKLE